MGMDLNHFTQQRESMPQEGRHMKHSDMDLYDSKSGRVYTWLWLRALDIGQVCWRNALG